MSSISSGSTKKPLSDFIVDDSEDFASTTATWTPPSSDSDTDATDTEEPPDHTPKRVTRVLIYVGCFNPPHVGHLNLLLHVYRHARSLNIVHAIIAPLNEASCMLKHPPKYYPFDWRKQQWEEDPDFPSWATVIPFGQLKTYRKNAKENIPEIGDNELRFITLLGPDHVHIGMEAPQGRKTEEVITSDQIRPANFDPATREHLTFSDCSPWMVLTHYVHAEISNFTVLDFNFAPENPRWYVAAAEESDQQDNLYYCQHTKERLVVIFVPRRGESQPELKELSSTAIRSRIVFNLKNKGPELSGCEHLILGKNRTPR